MSIDYELMGLQIAQAIKHGRPVASESKPTVTVNVPEVEVSVDSDKLAEAMRDGSHENAKALISGVSLLGEKWVEALNALHFDYPEPASNEGLEKNTLAVAGALKAMAENQDFQKFIEVISAQNEFLKDQARYLKDISETIRRPQRVKYDAQGRVTLVERG